MAHLSDGGTKESYYKKDSDGSGDYEATSEEREKPQKNTNKSVRDEVECIVASLFGLSTAAPAVTGRRLFIHGQGEGLRDAARTSAAEQGASGRNAASAQNRYYSEAFSKLPEEERQKLEDEALAIKGKNATELTRTATQEEVYR